MRKKLSQLWSRRRWTILGAGLVVFAGAGAGAVRLARSAGTTIPTAEVKRGDFVDWVKLRGDIKARKSIVLTTPFGAGDIQIVELAKNGSMVKKGDIVAKLDTTQQELTLSQRKSDLKGADADIERLRAQARLTEEQDQTDLAKAKYDVERARLEASKQEILSKIDGEKNKLTLANAEQKLREIEEKLKSDRTGAASDIESRRQKREKTLFEYRQAETNIAKLTLRAPVDGMVNLLPNWRAGGGGDSAPEYRAGDRAWPGASLAELPDLATLEVALRVDETDRGRVHRGLAATARVDAIPDKEFAGSVSEIGPVARADFTNWPPVKNFDLAMKLSELDSRLRPGMSTTVRIAVDRVPNSILIPAEAAILRNGRTLAYVLRGSKFEEREIKVGRRGGGQVIVLEGLNAGERVALRDPTLEQPR